MSVPEYNRLCVVEDDNDIHVVVTARLCDALEFASCKFRGMDSTSSCKIQPMGVQDGKRRYLVVCPSTDPKEVAGAVHAISAELGSDCEIAVAVLKAPGLHVPPLEKVEGDEA